MSESQPPSTSSSLLEQVRLHDEIAWRRLTELYGPTVYRWGRSAGLQPADAADVVQDVFHAVAVHIENFRRDRPGDTFRGWLWTIYRSKAMDFFRQRNLEPAAWGGDAVPGMMDAVAPEWPVDPSWADDADETADLVRRALELIKSDFTERTWQAFWRSAIVGECTSSIARDLQMSPAGVCMCRARVLRRLRETLAGMGEFPDL